MKSYENKTGLTLVEMLIVVAIVVILTTMVIGLAGRVNDQSKERLTKSTIAILDAALRQFNDYEYRYKPIYSGFDFPLDVIEPASGPLPANVIVTTLEQEFGLPVSIEPVNPGEPINHKVEYSSSELLYFFLSRVPECRKTLDKISRSDEDINIVRSLITDKDDNGYRMKIRVGTRYYPLLRIVDPWRTTLFYDYSYEYEPTPGSTIIVKRTFPIITSAGPDKQFGTADDISSRK